MIEHIVLALAVVVFVVLELRHRSRRSESLSSPVAREQELRRIGL
jgi:hypothetical protein